MVTESTKMTLLWSQYTTKALQEEKQTGQKTDCRLLECRIRDECCITRHNPSLVHSNFILRQSVHNLLITFTINHSFTHSLRSRLNPVIFWLKIIIFHLGSYLVLVLEILVIFRSIFNLGTSILFFTETVETGKRIKRVQTSIRQAAILNFVQFCCAQSTSVGLPKLKISET